MSGTTSSGSATASGVLSDLTPVPAGGTLDANGSAASVDATDHTVTLGGAAYPVGGVTSALVGGVTSAQTAATQALTALDALPSVPTGSYYVTDGGSLVKITEPVGTLPDGLVLDGNVYTNPNGVTLPTGLSQNGLVVMTDGSVYFPNTQSNGGVLCAVEQ